MSKDNNNNPKIAVIVPVYQIDEVLPRCIASILAQSFTNFALWLIDDGSTDGSAQICDEYTAKDKRIHVIHKKNEGLMKTWMRGVEESTAPYLCFVDGDDWIEKDMLSALNKALSGKEKEVTCCNYVIDRVNAKTQDQRKHGAPSGVYEGEELRTKLQEELIGHETRPVILSRCMKLFSRELIEENMSYCDPTIRMGEDVNIVVPALLDAKRVVLLENAYYYHYTFMADSMVHRFDPNLYDNIQKLHVVLSDILKSKEILHADEKSDREFLLQFFIEMKNELRASVPGTTARIQKEIRESNAEQLLLAYPEPILETANRLIALVIRYPNSLLIQIVRLIFRMQAKKAN